MNILIAASEAVPYCKTGGLADVIGALPKALARKNHTVSVFLPYYKVIQRPDFQLRKTPLQTKIKAGNKTYSLSLWRDSATTNPAFYFVRCDALYSRDGLYGRPGEGDFTDNDVRYAVFSQAILVFAKLLKTPIDVIHGHDWQTGLIPAYLKMPSYHDPFFQKTATVFTIHNMAYQGNFPSAALQRVGLPPSLFDVDGVEFYNQVSFMKAGLVYSDILYTVSPQYAKEIMSGAEFGFGMEGVLRNRRSDFYGILNGLDTDVWNPATDPYVKANYTLRTLPRRLICKKDLLFSTSLSSYKDPVVFGFVGRLDRQKGVDVIIGMVPSLILKGGVFVFLGVGDPQLEQDLHHLQRQYPDHVYVENNFAEPLAHKIYAGSDFFLMPSRFEPCGLGQLIALRYGAIPIVMPTGGLLDTVPDARKSAKGVGFVSPVQSEEAFHATVLEAMKQRTKASNFLKIQKRGMALRLSWDQSIIKTIRLYETAKNKHTVPKFLVH